MKWLFISFCLLHPLLDYCNGCDSPTESNPVSVCAFCLDSHTGVRWMVHRSNDDRSFFDPKRIDTIYIEFQCRNPQGDVIVRDDCFDGFRLPYVSTVSTGEWRWHILERYLSEGTQCNFTTTLENGFYFLKQKLKTSTCIVKSNSTTSPTPAVCSGEPGDSACSCSCSDGFSGGVGRAGGLLCRNVDECTSGTHQCGDVDNCMDTEGGYDCLQEYKSTTITSADEPTTTSTPSNAPITPTPPTDIIPVSVQAFCSEKHAGVKWMVDESNMNRTPKKIDLITIEFQCQTPDPEGDMISRDDCFDGDYLPYVTTVNTGEWRWHILEQQLSEGTECNFTATVENTILSSSHTLTSTCTVKQCSNLGDCTTSPTPAVCSGEPGDSVCSCSCSGGFSGGVGQAGVLLCRSNATSISSTVEMTVAIATATMSTTVRPGGESSTTESALCEE